MFTIYGKYALKGFMDRIWRTTLKIPETPQKSMSRGARSTSRNKSPQPGSEKRRTQSRSSLGRSSRHSSNDRRDDESSGCLGQAEEFAESVTKSLKVYQINIFSFVDLPSVGSNVIPVQ